MIAICVGHSRPGDGGSLSVDGTCEHIFNSRIAALTASRLSQMGEACTMIAGYQGASYGAAMIWLAKRLTDIGASVAVELHFNDSDSSSASGHQWLHWGRSARSQRLARLLDGRMQAAFPTLPARGLVPVTMADRGGDFCRSTPCPAVICEPFFGSNPADWALMSTHQDRLAQVIADGLVDWMGGRS